MPVPIHSDFADDFVVSDADRRPPAQSTMMCQVIVLATFHSKPAKVYIFSEMEGRPLAQNPDHAGKIEGSDLSDHQIGGILLQTHGCLHG